MTELHQTHEDDAELHPDDLQSVPREASWLLAMYAAAPGIPLGLLVSGTIYKQATPALLILSAPAGAMQLLDAGGGRLPGRRALSEVSLLL
jgi:hypothetical protein